ncbi:MAG: hypothetical protein JXN59_17375 [Anaerolineae bacterium]|nr:hypothetical protein [Anaerolineae bacterium]
MLEESAIKAELRGFITRALIHDPDYPLADDEPLLTGGLIDLASVQELAEFIEETFGVHVDEAEITTEHVDTLNELQELITSRMI